MFIKPIAVGVILSVSLLTTTTTLFAQQVPEKQEKPDVNVLKEQAREEVMQQNQATKMELTQQRDDFRVEMQSKREAIKTEMQERREAFKATLATIRDEQKQQIAQRIDARFATINQSRTDRMAAAIEKFEEILDELTASVNDAKATGTDTTAADAAIQEAETAIEAAKTAVTNQSGESYIAPLTTEASLGSAFSSTFTQLQSDMKTTHGAVMNAKQSVMKAASEVAKLKKISNNEEEEVN